MSIQKYSVNQHPIQTLLTWIKSDAITIPEIQRPFVWNASKVRDLIDSLYQGYPVGYLIAWQNPTVKLKDGSPSQGKRILIDGQQRITALMAAILGQQIIDKNYKRVKIKIAFHPVLRKFEVSNPAIQKDKTWIANIADVFSADFKTMKFVKQYLHFEDTDRDDDEIYESIELLKGIINNSIGLIELNSDLDIETVTEIFIRINSQGAVLNQSDFAMSKIAANEIYGGNQLRKCIDYFCHLAVAPEFYDVLADDSEFASTEYFQKMQWLKNENDDLYDPSYTDMLRVAFISEFKRGRLEDLVALLSGRNFETRSYEEEISEESFRKLKDGIFSFMNETNFKQFVMILCSAGFIDKSMIRSRNAINFSYVIYLFLRKKKISSDRIESFVRKWFVLSVLTGRYSGSPESTFDFDIKRIDELGIEHYLLEVEAANLSEAFWNSGLPQQMNTSVASSPYFKVFLASQIFDNNKGFLSKEITVPTLIQFKGDIHHIFPKQYLKENNIKRGQYNQIANYVVMQSEINIQIGKKPPHEYFTTLKEQCKTKEEEQYKTKKLIGGIIDAEQMLENFRSHCLPPEMHKKSVQDYNDFLQQRRRLMSHKIRDYYTRL
jgi:hypothetical protein